MMIKLLPMLFTAALAFGPGLAAAQDDPLEQLVIEMADTASEHAALAAYYKGKAEEARGQAVRHEDMARVYANSKFSQPSRTRAHCERLAENYKSIAEQYEDLAQLHEEEAKALEQDDKEPD